MEPKNCLIAIFQNNNDGTYNFRGSGFLISSEGHFLSVAHVFKSGNFNTEHFVAAFPSRSAVLYKITHLNEEYNEKLDQSGPVYKDLAYGKIEINVSEFLLLNNTRPEVGTSQTVIGYINSKEDENKNTFIINTDTKIDISDIVLDHPLDSKIISSNAIVSTDMRDYNNKPEHLIENKKKYNNCFTLKWAVHSGVSGGPVVNPDNSVSGVYFGGPETHTLCHCIASKYASKRINHWQ
jgi:V8-like Glu-specific endopeptidase